MFNTLQTQCLDPLLQYERIPQPLSNLTQSACWIANGFHCRLYRKTVSRLTASKPNYTANCSQWSRYAATG